MQYSNTAQLIKDYNITEEELNKLYDEVRASLINNLKIHLVEKMPNQSERENPAANMYYIYRGEISIDNVDQIMTCSYNRNYLLIPPRNQFGGVAMRLFDLLHIGFGHFYQWKLDDEKGSSDAWELGKIAYKTQKSIAELELLEIYERDACNLSMTKLGKLFIELGYDETSVIKFNNFFLDFIEAELNTHLDYCRNNTPNNLFQFWKKINRINNSFINT